MKKHVWTKKERTFRLAGGFCALLLFLSAAVLFAVGIHRVTGKIGEFADTGCVFFPFSDAEEPDFEESATPVLAYASEDGSVVCRVRWTEEEWARAAGESDGFYAHVYQDSTGERVAVYGETVAEDRVIAAFRDARTDRAAPLFDTAMALLLTATGLAVMAFFGVFFTTYEKIWFLGILILASVFAILFPEEDCNGVSGLAIMALYLADTFLNILCELLISKQSKWNFLVSVLVEIAEIAICLVLAYRFATMAVTLFFWLPIDIVSFINWNRHPDRYGEEVTEVRRLRGWQEVLVLSAILLWTLGVGYLLTLIDLGTDLFGGNALLETVVCYLDACASAVGIANGLFIFFRYREQWIAWYLEALLETAINLLSGQFVLLVLKFGYLTNTTYGYFRWTRYIRSHPEEKKSFL